MKKTFKRAGVAVLSMAMLLSMGAMTAITSNAAGVDNGKVTVTSANTGLKSGAQVKFYKVASISGGKWAWESAYKAAAETVIGASDDAAFAAFSDTTTWADNGAKSKELASALARVAASKSTTLQTTVNASTPIDLTAGYYVGIVQAADAGTVVEPILVEIKNDGGTTPKDIVLNKVSTIPFEKVITSVSDGTVNNTTASGKMAQASGNSKVSYQLKAFVPNYDPNAPVGGFSNYEIVDTPGTGIVISNTDRTTLTKAYESDGANLKVYIDGDGDFSTTTDRFEVTSDSTNVTIVPVSDGFKVSFAGSVVKNGFNYDGTAGADAIQGKYVFVTFDAKLDANTAVLAKGLSDRTDANKNDATVTYGNDYSTGGGAGTKEDHADVYTTAVRVFKENESNQKFPNVTFELHKNTADGTLVGTGTTDSDGYLQFNNLCAGTYVLVEKETAVNSAYKIAAPKSIVITNDSPVNSVFATSTSGWDDKTSTDGRFDTTIKNELRETLPGTGGMGTILFTVGGAAVVLLAGALFVVYMRRRKVEE